MEHSSRIGSNGTVKRTDIFIFYYADTTFNKSFSGYTIKKILTLKFQYQQRISIFLSFKILH